MGKRNLVAGGGGFVGSHLTDALIGRGESVVVLDSFVTGRRSNLAHLAGNEKVTVVEHDVTSPLPDLGGPFDVIFNLASPASPPKYQLDPVFTTMTNVLGTKHALDRALRDGARLFQASTSEVYGEPEVHPQPESYRGSVSTTGPRACYDEGKRVAETLCFDFHRQHGVDIRVARIFNTYGPRMDPDDGRVVSNFIMQSLRNEPLTIFGDGTQTRSFCYVSDLVAGILALVDHPTEIGPVNLGNDTEFTMLELVEAVGRATERQPLVERRPLPADDPTQRKPDLSRARTALRFEPRVALDEGLARTAEYFRGYLDGAKS